LPHVLDTSQSAPSVKWEEHDLHDIRIASQSQEDISSPRLLEIQADRAFVSVDRAEVVRDRASVFVPHSILTVCPESSGIVLKSSATDRTGYECTYTIAQIFYFDDIGTIVAEELSAERSLGTCKHATRCL
jgi:hypothetical protein